MKTLYKRTLSEVNPGQSCKMVAVKDNTAAFLQYVVHIGLGINNKIKVLNRQSYDAMMEIEVNGKISHVSEKFAENILVV